MTDISAYKHAYQCMVTARLMDEFVTGLVRDGRRVMHYHPGIGQEALSAGVAAVLNKEDYFFYTHRGVASLLAKGLSLKDVMYDLFMKDGGEKFGTNRGCGSKMHAYKPEIGIVGRNGVFGTRFPFAAGLALSSVIRGDNKVSVCMYGEAEGARGQYFETLNMAVLKKLPVVYIAEHNGFSVNSKTEDIYANGNMSDMWSGFGIPIIHFNGNDLEETMDAVSEAVARARAGEGPCVMEGFTYRVGPHSPMENPTDHLKYRTQAEVDAWLAKDPIAPARERLIQLGALTAEEDELFRKRIYDEVRANFAEIEKAETYPLEQAMTMVYYNDCL